MSCGAIRKQKYTDSTLLESTEAGKFEVACSGGVFWVGEIVILLSHFLLSSGSFNMALSRANCALKPLQSLSKWTPKIMTAMSMSKRKVRWPALRSVLGPILSCFLRLRAFYFYAITDWRDLYIIISNFPFPSSLQNTETRYFVLWNSQGFQQNPKNPITKI